ncbi:MAG: MerR family DNA-binding protein [Bradyrhizobium sp.]|uniref:MerR family DNA-binding protein n=1 Tax=Bradyrhizobium sp. TaxID=376 RepID=UPI0025C1A08A|nr:MerR family DNA-binding protein [Bradyrhizobium sp.]MCA3576384.1 MerR family DNA-binding protein [Bradyrhizobium sp.]
MQALTISKAAQEAGVGVETIRFYERRGLIEQPEKPGYAGYRHYSAETVRRIRFIRKAQQIGFSLREIQDLLWLRADPAADCSDVRQKAASKIDEVDEKIMELKKIRKALEKVIADCPGRGALKGCTILEALQDGERLENEMSSTRTRRKIR